MIEANQPKPTLSVVVPVYNSAASLPILTERLAGLAPQISTSFELILVNDCSRDDSWRVIRQLTEAYPWVIGIDLMRNYGQHNALLCGIRAAGGEVIVTMDDDLQHPVEEIPKLLARLAEGYDVVYGTPQHDEHALWRNSASWITKLALQSAMGASIARNVSAFRALRTPVRAGFDGYRSPFVSIDVLLTWGTVRFSAVPVRHEPRRLGSSNYTLSKLVLHALNMTTGFSTLPLHLATFTGFAFALFGFVVLAYVIGRVIVDGSSVPGFPFLASIITIFSGAQLFALGIIGEYLARMHFRLMERPAYAVRADTRSHA